jgi:hypothetical protein
MFYLVSLLGHIAPLTELMARPSRKEGRGLDFSGSERRQVADGFEHGDEPLSSTQYEQLFD